MAIVKRKHPIYIQVLIRLVFLFVAILALYFLVVYNYNPHARCDGDEHRHTMGPMFGFFVYSAAIALFWLIAMSSELIWRRFRGKKRNYLFTALLVVLITLTLLFFL